MQGATLFLGGPLAVAIKEGVGVLPEDVGDFDRGPGHGCGSPGRGASRSSGLRVVSPAVGETWV